MSLKFLCDAMHGKTARWLRMLGFDTFYSNAINVTDDELLDIAKKEKRVLLTKDKLFSLKLKKQKVPYFFMNEDSIIEEIISLSRHFGFHPEVVPPPHGNSRCPSCNGFLKLVHKEKLKNKIPSQTYKTFQEFWECQTPFCHKIYWKGNHWKKITQKLAKIRQLLKDNP